MCIVAGYANLDKWLLAGNGYGNVHGNVESFVHRNAVRAGHWVSATGLAGGVRKGRSSRPNQRAQCVSVCIYHEPRCYQEVKWTAKSEEREISREREHSHSTFRKRLCYLVSCPCPLLMRLLSATCYSVLATPYEYLFNIRSFLPMCLFCFRFP